LLSCYTSHKWIFNPVAPAGYLRKGSKTNNYETSSLREPISIHACLATKVTSEGVSDRGQSAVCQPNALASAHVT